MCLEGVGRSSKYLCGTLLFGRQKNRKYSYPHIPSDPSDFKRCYDFLNLFCTDTQKHILCIASDQNKREWGGLVDNWDELCKLYNEEKNQDKAPRLYEFMKSIR